MPRSAPRGRPPASGFAHHYENDKRRRRLGPDTRNALIVAVVAIVLLVAGLIAVAKHHRHALHDAPMTLHAELGALRSGARGREKHINQEHGGFAGQHEYLHHAHHYHQHDIHRPPHGAGHDSAQKPAHHQYDSSNVKHGVHQDAHDPNAAHHGSHYGHHAKDHGHYHYRHHHEMNMAPHLREANLRAMGYHHGFQDGRHNGHHH